MNRPLKNPNLSSFWSPPPAQTRCANQGGGEVERQSRLLLFDTLPPSSSSLLRLNVLSLTALMRRNDTAERDRVRLCVYTCGSKLRPCGSEKVTGSRWAGRKAGGGSALSTADAAAATLGALSLKVWTVQGWNYLWPAAKLYLLRLRNVIRIYCFQCFH